MKYFLIGIVIVIVFSLRPAPAPATICEVKLTNCLTEHIEWCSYDGDEWWELFVSASIGGINSGDTSEADCNGDSGCYYVVMETSSVVWLCTTYDLSGSSDGCNYACVDDSDGLTWHTGSSEYCCSDNACSTDC